MSAHGGSHGTSRMQSNGTRLKAGGTRRVARGCATRHSAGSHLMMHAFPRLRFAAPWACICRPPFGGFVFGDACFPTAAFRCAVGCHVPPAVRRVRRGFGVLSFPTVYPLVLRAVVACSIIQGHEGYETEESVTRRAPRKGIIMSHSYTKILIHCVFSTKRRRRWLSGDVSDHLNAYLAGVAREHRLHLIRAGGIADHRHLLLELPASVALCDAVRTLKANSSRWLRQTYPDCQSFEWQGGYSAFSVSISSRDSVIAYIDCQQDHHRTMTFDEELRVLLSKHGLEPVGAAEVAEARG